MNGLDNQFVTSNNDFDTTHGDYDGDLMPTDPGAIPNVGGGQGPIGNEVDGVPCEAQMSNNYHVHGFVGLFVNGKEIAVPDAIGIVHAGGAMTDPSSGWPNQELYGDCFYDMHTHDPSGLVHMESVDPSGAPITASLFTLGQLLDIWGIQVSATQFGPFSGLVTVYTSGQVYRGGCTSSQVWNCEIGTSEYQLWNGDPHNIPMYSHEAIWFEVGTGNPDAAHLPGVNFGTEY